MTEPPTLPLAIPLSRYQGVLLSVPVTVAGREETFLLDTGAGVTCLDAPVAKTLAGPEMGRLEAPRMTGEVVTFPLHRAPPLELGGWPLLLETVGGLDLSSSLPPNWPPVAGVLALDAFAEQPVTIDFAAGRIVLESAASLAHRVAERPSLQVRLVRHADDRTLDVYVAVRAGEGLCWLELDSGNTGPAVLAPATAAALGADADAMRSQAGPVAFDLSGAGAVTTPAVVKDLVIDGNLGLAFLEGRTLTFDLGAERAWVARSPSS